jgi:hypothetical protein
MPMVYKSTPMFILHGILISCSYTTPSGTNKLITGVQGDITSMPKNGDRANSPPLSEQVSFVRFQSKLLFAVSGGDDDSFW